MSNKWVDLDNDLETIDNQIQDLVPKVTLKLRNPDWNSRSGVHKQVLFLKKIQSELQLIKSKLLEKYKQIENESESDWKVGVAVAAVGLGVLGLISGRKKK